MSTDLERFRDHARTMAQAKHRPDCPPRDRAPRPVNQHRSKPSKCPGCVTSTDRALWARLADETDAYLNSQSDEALPL